MRFDLIVQYMQKRHTEMLAAHCDTKQRKNLQPILQEDLRALGVYEVLCPSRGMPDYGHAHFKMSWDVVIGSVSHPQSGTASQH